jgi:hypothetical protein
MDRIINKGNWFLVEIIERCEPVEVDKKNPRRRCTVWGNFHLIKAPTADKAIEKAEKIGREGNFAFKNTDQKELNWEFLGIGDILPIYENIEDKAELLWTDYGFITAGRSEKFIKTKRELLKKIKIKKK